MSDTRDRKDSELSHIYKEGGWPEPSRQIDAAILAAARAQHSFLRRWSPPLALAATVVLSFTLLLRMSEEKPNDALYSLPILDRQPAVGEPKPATAPEPTPTPKPAAIPESAPVSKSTSAERSAPATKPAPTPPSASAAKSTSAPRSTPSEKPAVPPRPAPAPRPAAAPSAPAPAAAASAFALKKETPEAARADRVERQPQLDQRSRALESAPPRGLPQEVRSESAPTPRPAPETPTLQRAPASGANALSGAIADGPTGTVVRSPQNWLEEVRKLKGEGKTAEAARELAEFKKRYPDYELPVDLR